MKTRSTSTCAQPGGEIVIYRASDGGPALDVRLQQDTVWLTQKQMSDLFATERSIITKHLGNIFGSKELAEESNVQKMHIAGSDRPVVFYSLDAIDGDRINRMDRIKTKPHRLR